MKRGIILLLLLFPQLARSALFKAAVEENLNPRWSGMGGVRLFSDEGPEAAFSNPAGLPLGKGNISLSAAGGTGFEGASLAGGALSWAPQDDYGFALSWDQRRRQGLGAREESNAGLTATLVLSDRVRTGAAWRLHRLNASGLSAPARGGSLDLGFQGSLQKLPGLPGGLRWAVVTQGLAPNWSSESWQRAAPLNLRLGVAVVPLASLRVVFEKGWSSDAVSPQGGRGSFSVGAQWRFWQAWFLRTGYRGAEQSGAALGLGWKSSRWPVALDYSADFSNASEGTKHRFALQSSFSASTREKAQRDFSKVLALKKIAIPQLQAVLASSSGAALSRLNIEMPALNGQDMQGWEIEIKDSQGKTLKVLKGEADMPQSLSWDGRDRQGLAISDGLGLQVVFSYRDKKGKQFSAGRPVFTQKSFNRARKKALARPRLALASVGQSLMENSIDFVLSRQFLEQALKNQRIRALQKDKVRFSNNIQTPQNGSVVENTVPWKNSLGTASSIAGEKYILKVYKLGEFKLRKEHRNALAPLLRAVKSRPGLVLKVTGLVEKGEGDALSLSRKRMLDMAEEMVLSGHEGSFLLEVSSGAGKARGVLVEIVEP